MSGRLAGRSAVLGEERLLERGLAADEVEELVARRLADDGRDRARYPKSEDVVVGHDVAHARQGGEGRLRHIAGKPQLDLVVGEIAERLDPVDLHEDPVAD